MDGRSEKFLDHLIHEKEIHKEHRHKHVLHKLVVTGSFFGLGQFSLEPPSLHLFLYAVPIVALVHDLYIFAEDYKVKRVGFFFRTIPVPPLSAEELAWEGDFLPRYREKYAYVASLVYTGIMTLLAAASAYALDFAPSRERSASFFVVWLSLCLILIVVVFVFARSLRRRIVSMETELRQ